MRKANYKKIAKRNHHPFTMKALEDIQAINRECLNGVEVMADLDYLNVLDSLFDLAFRLGAESKTSVNEKDREVAKHFFYGKDI